MLDVSKSIKIWAVAVALGGTFTTFEIFEKSLFQGDIKSTLKQAFYIVAALIGANSGYSFIKFFQYLGAPWLK